MLLLCLPRSRAGVLAEQLASSTAVALDIVRRVNASVPLRTNSAVCVHDLSSGAQPSVCPTMPSGTWPTAPGNLYSLGLGGSTTPGSEEWAVAQETRVTSCAKRITLWRSCP